MIAALYERSQKRNVICVGRPSSLQDMVQQVHSELQSELEVNNCRFFYIAVLTCVALAREIFLSLRLILKPTSLLHNFLPVLDQISF